MSIFKGSLISYFPRYWTVAFAGASLAYGNAQEHSIEVAVFVFLGIFLVYNRYLFVESKYGVKGKSILIALLFLCVCLAYQIITTFSLFYSILASGILGLFYSQKIPFIKYTLRDIPSFKVILVVGVWTYVTCFFPILITQSEIDWISYSLPSLFILAISLLFDLRDIHIDSFSRKTIPQLIGVSATKSLVLCLICCYVFLLYVFNIQLNMFCIYMASGLLIFLLLFPKGMNERYQASLLEFSLVILGMGYWL